MNRQQAPAMPPNITSQKEIQLFEQLTAFSHTAQIPVSFFNEKLECIWECLPRRKFCSIFPPGKACSSGCRDCLARAHRASLGIHDPFIFLCDSGMVQITYPLITDQCIKGAVFAGPVLMGLNRQHAIKRFVKDLPCTKDYMPEILTYLEENQVKSPMEISYLYDVFCSSIFSYRLEEKGFVPPQMLWNGIQPQLTAQEDLYDTSLLLALRSGSGEAAAAAFRVYYEKIYLAAMGNPNRIRLQLLELFTTLSMNIISDFFLTADFPASLECVKTAITPEELFSLAQRLILQIAENSVPSVYGGGSAIIKDALAYVHENFQQDLTLKSLSEAINVNPSYLSSLLKKETGFTFSQHLTSVRLNKSLQLLADTHLSVTEISMRCGFSSQSYYIKTFRERFHKTPGSYRRQILKDQRKTAE